ncbi:MAG: hypothetical protein J6R66_00775 [Clostridia bacterium]|nr:hypothetical protein [Clostridia bacterium]
MSDSKEIKEIQETENHDNTSGAVKKKSKKKAVIAIIAVLIIAAIAGVVLSGVLGEGSRNKSEQEPVEEINAAQNAVISVYENGVKNPYYGYNLKVEKLIASQNSEAAAQSEEVLNCDVTSDIDTKSLVDIHDLKVGDRYIITVTDLKENSKRKAQVIVTIVETAGEDEIRVEIPFEAVSLHPFKKELTRNTGDKVYILYDVDGNGVPEAIIRNNRNQQHTTYTINEEGKCRGAGSFKTDVIYEDTKEQRLVFIKEENDKTECYAVKLSGDDGVGIEEITKPADEDLREVKAEEFYPTSDLGPVDDYKYNQ